MGYAPPNPGTILGGYKFLGGDPKQQSNWQPVGPDAIAEAKAGGTVMGKKGPVGVNQGAFNDAATQLKDVSAVKANVNDGILGLGGNVGYFAKMSAPHLNSNGAQVDGIPGTAGYNLDKELSTIRSRIMLANMAKLKTQSATGATGMGNLSNAEGDTLQSTIAPLDVGLPGGQLRTNLDRVREEIIRNQPGLVVSNPYTRDPNQPVDTHIPRGAYYRDPMGNIRRNENGDTGNPIIKPRRGQSMPQAAAAKPAPQGVDPTIWAHMTPQEQALWH
jgi:hypothetical protein